MGGPAVVMLGLDVDSQESWSPVGHFELAGENDMLAPDLNSRVSPARKQTWIARGVVGVCGVGLIFVAVHEYGVYKAWLQSSVGEGIERIKIATPSLGHQGVKAAVDPHFNKSDCCFSRFPRKEIPGKPGAGAWWPYDCVFRTPGPHDYFVVFHQFENLENSDYHFTAHDWNDGNKALVWVDSGKTVKGSYGPSNTGGVGITCDRFVFGCAFAFNLEVCSAALTVETRPSV